MLSAQADVIKTLERALVDKMAEIERLEIELKAMRGSANSYKAEGKKKKRR